MKKTLIALAAALSIGVVHAEQQNVTVIVNSGSTMTQGIAMVLANQMQAQGAQVHVLLCDQAGDLGLRDAGGEALKPNNVTPAQLLGAAMEKGATAAVCALYLPNTGHAPEALRDGITPARPDAMGAALLEPSRKVMVF